MFLTCFISIWSSFIENNLYKCVTCFLLENRNEMRNFQKIILGYFSTNYLDMWPVGFQKEGDMVQPDTCLPLNWTLDWLIWHEHPPTLSNKGHVMQDKCDISNKSLKPVTCDVQIEWNGVVDNRQSLRWRSPFVVHEDRECGVLMCAGWMWTERESQH